MTAYTLYGQEATGSSLASDTDPYTSGVQFSVSEACTLTAIWYYSPSGAAVLPGTIALYEVSGTVLVASQDASWSGAAGSGWVRAPFTSPPALTASTAYKGCVFYAGGSEWYGLSDPSYYTTGAGAAGIMNGPLTAPNNAGASPGQCSYATGGSLAYPDESDAGANNWVDIEVTASGETVTTTVLNTTVSFPAPGITDVQNETVTPGALSTTVSFPAPVIHTGEVVTTAPLNTAVSFSPASVFTGSPPGWQSLPIPPGQAFAPLSRQFGPGSPFTTMVPGPVLLSVTITPPVLNTTISFSQAIHSGETVTTVALSTTVSFPLPAESTGSTVTTAALNIAAAFTPASVTAGTPPAWQALPIPPGQSFPPLSRQFGPNAPFTVTQPGPSAAVSVVITPTALNTIVSFPSANIHTGETVTTATFSTTVSFPAVIIHTGETVTATALNATISFPVVIIHTGETVHPSALNTTVSFPATSIHTGETVTSTALSTSATFPAQSFSAGSTITTTALNVAAAFPPLSIFAGTPPAWQALQIPPVRPFPPLSGRFGPVAPFAAAPPVFLQIVSAAITPGTLTTSVSFPAQTIHAGSKVTTSVLNTTVVFTFTPEASQTAKPSVLSTTITFPASTRHAGETAKPSALATTVTFAAANIHTGSKVTPAVFTVTTTFPGQVRNFPGTVTITNQLSGQVTLSQLLTGSVSVENSDVLQYLYEWQRSPVGSDFP